MSPHVHLRVRHVRAVSAGNQRNGPSNWPVLRQHRGSALLLSDSRRQRPGRLPQTHSCRVLSGRSDQVASNSPTCSNCQVAETCQWSWRTIITNVVGRGWRRPEAGHPPTPSVWHLEESLRALHPGLLPPPQPYFHLLFRVRKMLFEKSQKKDVKKGKRTFQ